MNGRDYKDFFAHRVHAGNRRYEELRSVFVEEQPMKEVAQRLVMNYARRNGVEDALGSSVNFFYLDCLSTEVRLNVDLNTVLTVLANGCYRWLASQLHGYDQSKPKVLYRKFVETFGAVEIEAGRRIVVYFDRRSHNPILREAETSAPQRLVPLLTAPLFRS